MLQRDAENTRSDAILWYNVGIFGDDGYAYPNPSNDFGSLNPNILEFTIMAGTELAHKAFDNREDNYRAAYGLMGME